MVNHLLKVSNISTEKSSYIKKTKVKKHSRNAKRRIRRKRNKFRYNRSLRKQRKVKNTEELCKSVNFFDITDMEWSSAIGTSSSYLPEEIIEWQKRDQIAYWKSKALSLELENQMLKQHLRDVYSKTIQDYALYDQMNQKHLESGIDQNSTIKSDGHILKLSETQVNDKNFQKTKVTEIVTPNFPELKNRSEELKKIYGDKAPKILGMETALQLNYERHLEKSNASYWPHVPLNFK